MKACEMMKAVVMVAGVAVMVIVTNGCAGHEARVSEQPAVAGVGATAAHGQGEGATQWRTPKEIVGEIQTEAERLAELHDAEQRMECADAVVAKTDMALANVRMPEEARMQVEMMRRKALYIRDKANVMVLWERAEKAYAERNSYDNLMYELLRLRAALVAVRHQEYVPIGNKVELEDMAQAIDRVIKKERERYEESRKKVAEALEWKRRVFVNQMAVRDCKAAQELLNAQKKKFMNIMGVRDDVKELVKAARLTARVLGDTRVDEPVQLKAVELHVTCTRRMGTKGREMLRSMHAMSGYDNMENYPDMTAGEQQAMAEQIWRERGRETPVMDDGVQLGMVEMRQIRN